MPKDAFWCILSFKKHIYSISLVWLKYYFLKQYFTVILYSFIVRVFGFSYLIV